METSNQKIIVITYTSSVKVLAGWRSVSIKAEAEKVSEKMAIVKNVIEIDGEIPSKNQSRTGAKRQKFDGVWWSKTQIGAKKRLSACVVL